MTIMDKVHLHFECCPFTVLAYLIVKGSKYIILKNFSYLQLNFFFFNIILLFFFFCCYDQKTKVRRKSLMDLRAENIVSIVVFEIKKKFCFTKNNVSDIIYVCNNDNCV